MEEEEYTHIPLTSQEEDELYGKRKNDIGLCFKLQSHYYKQCKDHILHVNGNIINTLHVGTLNAKLDNGLELIDSSIFDSKVKEAIYNMSIYEYWNFGILKNNL